MPHSWRPLVTIAIPTFNRASTFLPKALSAACNQTYGNLDILVADNASEDGTAQLVETFGDPRIRYHRHETNIGPNNNLDFCIQGSRGEYTLLLNDDDSIDPDFVESCIDFARSHPEAGLIRTGARFVNEEGEVYDVPNLVAGLNFVDFVGAWTEGRTAPLLCSTLFKTEPLKLIGMRSQYNRWNDVITELEIASRYGRADIPEIKASFLTHSGEQTANSRIEEWCGDARHVIDLVCRLAPDQADQLKRKLQPYLAVLSYRTAAGMNAAWPRRLQACLAVYRTFETMPEGDIIRSCFRDTPWYQAVRNLKYRAGL